MLLSPAKKFNLWNLLAGVALFLPGVKEFSSALKMQWNQQTEPLQHSSNHRYRRNPWVGWTEERGGGRDHRVRPITSCWGDSQDKQVHLFLVLLSY